MLCFTKDTGLQISLNVPNITQDNLLQLSESEMVYLIDKRKKWRNDLNNLLHAQEGLVNREKRKKIADLTEDYLRNIDAKMQQVAIRRGVIGRSHKIMMKIFDVEEAIGHKVAEDPNWIVGIILNSVSLIQGKKVDIPSNLALYGINDLSPVTAFGEAIASNAKARKQRILYNTVGDGSDLTAEIAPDHINDLVYF